MNTVKIFIDRMRKSWYIKTTDLTDILTDSVWGLYDDPAVTAFMEVAEPYVKFQVYRKHDYILLTSEDFEGNKHFLKLQLNYSTDFGIGCEVVYAVGEFWSETR